MQEYDLVLDTMSDWLLPITRICTNCTGIDTQYEQNSTSYQTENIELRVNEYGPFWVIG